MHKWVQLFMAAIADDRTQRKSGKKRRREQH
jgi:hypothetical protein